MSNRTGRPILLAAGVGGVVCLLAFTALDGPGGSRAPAPWTERAAYAQGPGARLRYGVVAERSEARYRVREQLVGFNLPNDATGTTNAIEGGISLDPQGHVLAGDSRFTIDPRMLKSDEARRDNYIRRNTLETDRYPAIVFTPTEVRGLRFPLAQTGTVSFQVAGDLTVRDVTRRVTWEATATFDGQDVGVQAKTAFRFGDFGLRTPRVSVVLSVEDNIHLEADLVLRPGR